MKDHTKTMQQLDDSIKQAQIRLSRLRRNDKEIKESVARFNELKEKVKKIYPTYLT